MGNKKILAIESTSNVCSVGLSINNEIIAEYSIFLKNYHDKMLAELTNRILTDFNIKAEELDFVAVSSGPGSFTGIRIGGSIAMGLAFGEKSKTINIPTINVLAFNSLEIAKQLNKNKILVTINSHKNLYYTQLFNLELNPISEIELIDEKQILKNDFENTLLISNFNSKNHLLNELEKLSASKILNYVKSLIEIKTDELFEPIYIQEFNPK